MSKNRQYKAVTLPPKIILDLEKMTISKNSNDIFTKCKAQQLNEPIPKISNEFIPIFIKSQGYRTNTFRIGNKEETGPLKCVFSTPPSEKPKSALRKRGTSFEPRRKSGGICLVTETASAREMTLKVIQPKTKKPTKSLDNLGRLTSAKTKPKGLDNLQEEIPRVRTGSKPKTYYSPDPFASLPSSNLGPVPTTLKRLQEAWSIPPKPFYFEEPLSNFVMKEPDDGASVQTEIPNEFNRAYEGSCKRLQKYPNYYSYICSLARREINRMDLSENESARKFKEVIIYHAKHSRMFKYYSSLDRQYQPFTEE